ncbi:interleukin-15 isoform X5 [Pseudorasbora parva]|uniref:interleukin-15 isoform X5 n=1 Tax=Pseudorasbora parva TaxID=51549 RepID=UPI00351E349F
MILMTLFLAFIVGFWNRPPKLKAKRTGRCVCNPWCNEIRMECLLNSEVWNSILILSCLSALLPMAEGHAMQVLRDLQNALNETEDLFSKSDARLYTPNIDHINVCTNTFFDCFLMEMNVLLHEEDPTNPKMVEIQRTLDHYTSMNIMDGTEYYCEQEELADPKVFFKRMNTLLQKQISLCNNP